MGHLFSRALKRFTQCSGGRNQLPSNSTNGPNHEHQTATDARQGGQDSDRPVIQSIPVGQSIDSAEYAAFKTTSNSFDETEENSAPNQGATTAAELKDGKENENAKRQQNEYNEMATTNDQSKPEVEEAVIKIQALVRGHLTRKALKDAQQQAAAVPPNALGQSQFDEESLRNPPNAVFSNVSPANPANLSSLNNNNNNNNQHQSSKLSNSRVPPLESIAEDVESANQPTSRSTREKRKLLPPLDRSSGSASDSTGESAGPQPTSPSNEANVSIDIHCDTPASASIDIKDHTSKPMPPIAAVLHHKVSHDPERTTPTTDQQHPPEQQQRVASGTFELPNLATFESSVDDQHALSASSLPSSPPHINLAATTNSHSIDSEAAAIRIQSAFRGYHTRKHSPYRRRSPANAISPPTTRPANHINSSETNGQPKRSTLRQQDATILDEDDDEGVEGCERLTGAVDGCNEGDQNAESLGHHKTDTSQDSEENRKSRLRHRSDEGHSIDDPPGQLTSVKNIASTTIDDTDDQSTVKELRSDGSRHEPISRADDQTVPPDTTNEAAVLTAAETDDHLEPPEQLDVERKDRLSIGEANSGARWSTSLDTDSSNLGAALSLNEDLSEGVMSQMSQGRSTQPRWSEQRDSMGIVTEAAEGSVEGLNTVGEEPASVSRDLTSQQLDELDRVTSQLEAALEEATDKEASYYGESRLEEGLPDGILDDETQQNWNELESDDIEKRDPSGLVSEDRSKSPQASEFNQQPALVASDSLDEVAQDPARVEQQNQPRLDVISPDEAIGSGGSSPVPPVSHDGNTSDDGADSDQEQEGQQQQEGCSTSGGPTRTGNNQQGGNGGKNRKRNRNKRKGKK